MKTLQQGKAASNRRRLVARLLLGVALVLGLMMPPLRESKAAGQTTCRTESALDIKQITSAMAAHPRGDLLHWSVSFTIKSPHSMDCTPVIVLCNRDKYTYRPSISSANILEVEDSGIFLCNTPFFVTLTPGSTGFDFGFKVRFQENAPFHPKRKLAVLTIRFTDVDADSDAPIDVTDLLVTLPDDGTDN
ncbi:MAG TPA: hypothetical protein VJH03_11115 [Blastocatellia bacterium]|nr:hypothetical protein [Blastocatellia bacterium]